MCNHVQPFPLKFKLQGHCEWWSFSFATISVVTHVITDSYSRTQAKDTRLNTAPRISTNTTIPTPLNPGIAVSSSVRIDIRSSMRRRRIPAASRRQVLRTCGSWVTKQASFPAHRRSSTMQTLFRRGYTEKHARNAPGQSHQL